MTTSWNPDFLKNYQKSFAEAVLTDAYADRDALGGKDLLHLSPCKQLNFFVMKALFNQWQEEMKRLESPFFDYKTPEVKKAMVQFMNVLSQHIRAERGDITPLVESAVEQCLLIVIEPGEFVRRQFEGKMEANFSAKQASQLLKYIKVLSQEFHDFFLEKAEGTNEEVVNSAVEYFESVDLTEAQEKMLGELSEVEPIALENVLDITVSDQAAQEAEADTEGEEEDEPEPVFDPMEDSEEPAEEEESVVQPEAQEPERPVTVNDQFEKKSDQPLVEHLQQAGKVNSIMESISLNQRYMFAQELFAGDANVFQRAIGEVEHERSFDEAVEHLVTTYAGDHEWDMNSDVVKELLKAVFRKFR